MKGDGEAGGALEASGTSTARTVLVLRHAKAAGEPGVNDLHRPLTARGRRNAGEAGRWLLAQDIVPDRVVCSSAERTRETWALLSAELGAAAPGPAAVTFDRRAYDADAQGLFYLVAEQPDEAGSVLIVGHNPASHQLVAELTGRRDIAFPACALAVVRLTGSWAGAAPGGGELASLWTPR